MRLRRLLGLATVLLFCAGTAAATSPPISIYLDRSELNLPVDAQLVDGRTMVPLRAVAEALGAQVDWLPDGRGGGVVHLTSYPLHFSPPPGTGSALSQRSSPADPQALGASAALIQYLAAEQAASLTGGGPTLVRFELLDLESSCYYPPPAEFERFCANGFHFAIRLYYSQYEAPEFPIGVAAYERVTEEGGIRVSGVQRAPSRSWYEDLTIWVRPAGEPVLTGSPGRTVVAHGDQGWRVDSASRTTLQTVPLERLPFLIHGSYGR